MYDGDWGRERPSVVLRVLHEGWGLLGKVWVYSTNVRTSCSMRIPWPVRSHPRAAVGCVGGGHLSMTGGRLMPLTQAVTTPSAAYRGNRTRSMPALSGPGRGVRLSVRRIENCVLQPDFSLKRWWSCPSCLQESAVLGGKVSCRSGPARGINAGRPGKAGEQRHRAGCRSQVPLDAAAGLG